MALPREKTAYESLADFLSIITVAICFILKVPQILNLLKVKNAQGLSLLGLLLELSSYTIMCSYNYRNHYALLSYLEYPIILIQEIILITLVLHYKNRLNSQSLIGAAVYFAIAASFFLGYFPREFLTFLVPLCTPIGASAKVVQIVEILKTQDSESVSLLTWFISAFTNLTRIYTIYIDSADAALLLNFSVNVVLSSLVFITAYMYKKHEKVE